MRPDLRPRQPASFSDTLRRQLDGYTLAASAAGVGLLTLASPAQARIVYTPANLPLTNYSLDLNHDGIIDFAFVDSTVVHSITGVTWEMIGAVPQSNEFMGKKKHGATPVAAGELIDSHGKWDNHGGVVYGLIAEDLDHYRTSVHRWTSRLLGPWSNDGKGFKHRYLGLKFLIKGKFHYGWARLDTTGTSGSMVRLTGYAYETVPNKPIVAGQTKGPDVVMRVPESTAGTLGKLALGKSQAVR